MNASTYGSRRSPIGEDAGELLRLVAEHPDQHQRQRTAQALPVHRWPEVLRLLVLRRDPTAVIYAQGISDDVADAVFAHLAALRRVVPARVFLDDTDFSWVPDTAPDWVREWWQTCPARFAPIVHHIASVIEEVMFALSKRISPATATAYVRDHTHETHTGARLMQRLVERVNDPETMTLLFHTHKPVQTYDDHPYPWRASCLRRGGLPQHLRDQVLVDSGATAGPPRHQTLAYQTPHVLDDARVAATHGSPTHVAALVLADPERWWPEMVRYNVTRTKPRGTGPRPNTDPVHQALAVQIREAINRLVDEDLLGAEEVWLGHRRLATRHTLAERLVWLAEKAEGPGFEAVLDALATHPQAMVRRRVAKHPQIPAALAAAFMQDSDRWVRAGAARAFERALAVA